MGKHAAPEGAARHPLVSGALSARPERTSGAHSEDTAQEGSVGWPGAPAPDGGGLGWPADLPPATSQAEASQDGASQDGASQDGASQDGASADRVQPRGWRRFFGLSRVA